MTMMLLAIIITKPTNTRYPKLSTEDINIRLLDTVGNYID